MLNSEISVVSWREKIKVTVVYSKVLFQHFLGGNLINHKNSEDTHPLSQGCKHEPLNKEAVEYDIRYCTLKRIQ
jgi:hypothetical protein